MGFENPWVEDKNSGEWIHLSDTGVHEYGECEDEKEYKKKSSIEKKPGDDNGKVESKYAKNQWDNDKKGDKEKYLEEEPKDGNNKKESNYATNQWGNDKEKYLEKGKDSN